MVITGMGIITPLAYGVESFREAFRSDRSGISEIHRFSTEGLRSRIGGVIEDFEPRRHTR